MKNFEQNTCYIHQKKAKNIQNSDSGRTRVNRYSIARVDRENRKKSLIGSEEMNERKTNRQNEFKRIIHKI